MLHCILFIFLSDWNSSTVLFHLIVSITVLSPVIVSITSSPVLLQFGNMTTLNCSAMGGPRLNLTWQRNGENVAMGIMGDQVVTHNIVLAGNDDIGDYTCHATIDSIQDEESVTVIGKFSIKLLNYVHIRKTIFSSVRS